MLVITRVTYLGMFRYGTVLEVDAGDPDVVRHLARGWLEEYVGPVPPEPPPPINYQRFDADLENIATQGTTSYGRGVLAVTGPAALRAYAEVVATTPMTASEILTSLKTVDGVGSGLDADLLAGQPGSYYVGLVTAETDARASADTAHTSALAAKADLVGGVVPTSQLPTIPTGNTTTSVASQADMLALAVDIGDIAIRTDLAGQRYLLANVPASTLANWVLLDDTDAVTSVNGQLGAVVLGKADVGLGSVDNTSDAAKPVSTAQQAALDAKATVVSVDALDVRLDALEAGGRVGRSETVARTANSVAEITVASFTLPANASAAGDEVYLHSRFVIFNNSGAANTVTFRFKIAGVTIATTTAISIATATTFSPFSLDVSAIVRDADSIEAAVALEGSNAVAALSTVGLLNANRSSRGVTGSDAVYASGTAQVWELTAQMSAAHLDAWVEHRASFLDLIKGA